MKYITRVGETPMRRVRPKAMCILVYPYAKGHRWGLVNYPGGC